MLHRPVEPSLFTNPEHFAVEAAPGLYQAVVAAYRLPYRATGRAMMTEVINPLSYRLATALSEVAALRRARISVRQVSRSPSCSYRKCSA